MSWRSIQLGQELCDQDRLILELFGKNPVEYRGSDIEFAQTLNQDPAARDLILVLNDRLWVSDIIYQVVQCLHSKIYHRVYISVNRYCIIGNDTTLEFNNTGEGETVLELLTTLLVSRGYKIAHKGAFDQDRGLYFNFVQPLTWIYAIHTDFASH